MSRPNARPRRALNDRRLRAIWVEQEGLRLASLGMSFPQVADLLTRAGRAAKKRELGIALVQDEIRALAMVTNPNFSFPDDYRISRQAVHKAVTKALIQFRSENAVIARDVLDARLDDIYLRLQAGIQRGDPRAAIAGIKALEAKARLHGLFAPEKHEISGRDGRPVEIRDATPLPPLTPEQEREEAIKALSILAEIGVLQMMADGTVQMLRTTAPGEATLALANGTLAEASGEKDEGD